MNVSQSFRVNSPTVVSEVFDDEIIIIHLDSGAYYSLSQSGADIWQLLQSGATLSEITANLAATYALRPAAIESTVQQFVAELAQEQLLIPQNTATQPSQPFAAPVVGAAVPSRYGRFVAPALHKYTDMQDLLLLDPIHDVTESGWPHVKAH
ncbi:MAG: PqqD family protein [Caldilineaceae bacterium]